MSLVKYNNNSISAITTAGQLALGSMVLIKEQTASNDSTVSFVDGSSDVVLDNTYPIYLFKFINVNAVSGATTPNFSFNASDDSSSHSYDITKTSTAVQSWHKEDGSNYGLFYNTSFDLAQSTAFQQMGFGDGNTDADASGSGELYLINPSSTTFVKHFIATFQNCASDPSSERDLVAGYFNTTSALTGMQFKYDSGNIDSGTIKLYGIKDS